MTSRRDVQQDVDPAEVTAAWGAATAGLPAPLAVVDLDAFDANADDLVRRAGGLPIRVASKSVRCRPCSSGRWRGPVSPG